MFQTATIWNICQDTHRRYRFTGEAERFVCWLREGAAEKLRGSNAICHLYISVFKLLQVIDNISRNHLKFL